MHALSVVLYQTWLNHTSNSLAYAVYFNLGALLSSLNLNEEAETAYRKAIELSPNFMHPRLNLGLLLEGKGQFDEATEQWEWVAEHCPNDKDNQILFLTKQSITSRAALPSRRINPMRFITGYS